MNIVSTKTWNGGTIYGYSMVHSLLKLFRHNRHTSGPAEDICKLKSDKLHILFLQEGDYIVFGVFHLFLLVGDVALLRSSSLFGFHYIKLSIENHVFVSVKYIAPL